MFERTHLNLTQPIHHPGLPRKSSWTDSPPDVDNLELAVLPKMENFLANAANKLLIVCEIKPWEIGKLGYTMKDFAAQLKRFGYAVFEMDDPRKRVDLATMVDMGTLMFRAELR